jgi:hypothetical protein
MLHYKVRYYYYLRFSIVVHVSSFLISEINIGLHYSTVYFFSYIKENARMLMGQPPRPPGPIFSIFFPISVYCAKWFLLGCFCFLSLDYIRERNVIRAE